MNNVLNLSFVASYVSITGMNNLRNYADQVKYISDEMKAGRMGVVQGALRLQAVATLAEQDADVAEDDRYAVRLHTFAEMIYDVIEKMNPEQRVIQ